MIRHFGDDVIVDWNEINHRNGHTMRLDNPFESYDYVLKRATGSRELLTD